MIIVKPCPFCGEEDVFFEEISPGKTAVCCPECEAIGPTSVDINECIELWNKAWNKGKKLK